VHACMRPARQGPAPRTELAELLAVWALFVLFHLDAIHTWGVFRDLRFLTLAAILGAACTLTAAATRSLWPGIILHWLWVWAWFVLVS
jgi:predicted Abi (CAAX) family protease